MTLARFQMCIGGEWVDALSGKTFESLNPALAQAWAELPDAAKPMSNAPSRLRKRRSRALPGVA